MRCQPLLHVCLRHSLLPHLLPACCLPGPACPPALHRQGILYEDTYLQVGLQARLTRSRGELLLYLGNKQAGQAISGLALALAAAPPQLQVVLGQLPPQLAPKQQVQVRATRDACCMYGRTRSWPSQHLPAMQCLAAMLPVHAADTRAPAPSVCTPLPLARLRRCVQVLVQVTCLAPFAEPPRLRLAYSSGGRLVAQELLLPLGCHKFLEPQPHIARDGFFEQWKAYSGARAACMLCALRACMLHLHCCCCPPPAVLCCKRATVRASAHTLHRPTAAPQARRSSCSRWWSGRARWAWRRRWACCAACTGALSTATSTPARTTRRARACLWRGRRAARARCSARWAAARGRGQQGRGVCSCRHASCCCWNASRSDTAAAAAAAVAAAARGAQCRVEGNPQNRMQFRVTVAAPDAMLAAGLRDVLVAQLLAAP